MYLVQAFEIGWLGGVIEHISSNYKAIVKFADSFNTDNFFTCKQLHVCNYPHAFLKKRRGYCNRLRQSVRATDMDLGAFLVVWR